MSSFEIILSCSHRILFKNLNGKFQMECLICKSKFKVQDLLKISFNVDKIKRFELEKETKKYKEYKAQVNMYKLDPEFYVKDILYPILIELDLRREKIFEYLINCINDYYEELRNKLERECEIRKECFETEIEEIENLEKNLDQKNLILLREINKRLKASISRFTEKKYEFNLNDKELNIEELFGKLVLNKPLNNSKYLNLKQNLQGHTSGICELKLIDNKILSASWDKSIILWDFQTGKLIRKFTGHKFCVNCICVIYSDMFATGSMDNTIKIWSLNSGLCQKTINGHLDSVDCIKLLKNGYLISGSSDCTIKKWNLSNGICLVTFRGHSSMVKCIEENNDGTIASGSYDKTIRVWDQDGNCLKIIESHSDYVTCVLFFPNNILVSGSNDKTIKFWDLNTDEIVNVLNENSDSIKSLFQIEKNILLSCSLDGILKTWNIDSGVCIETLKVKNHLITCLAIGENNVIISGSSDSLIRIYN